MDRALAGGIAFVAGSLPAVVFFAPLVLPNAILTPLLLGWLLATHAWLMRGRVAAAIISGGLLGFMYVVHVRALLLLPAAAVIIGVALLRRRITMATSAVSVAAMFAVMTLHPVLKSALAGKVVTGGTEPENRMLEAIFSTAGLVRVLSDGAGQIWYLIVATWSLAAIGLIFTGYQAVRSRLKPPTDLIMVSLLASTLLIAIVTAAALPDDGKINNHLYPGYLIFLAPIWLVAGFAALLKTARQTLTVGFAAAGATVLAWFVVELNLQRRADEWFTPIDAPELSFLANDWTELHPSWVTRITLAFLIAIVMLAWLRERWPMAAVPILAGLVVINVLAVQAASVKMGEFAQQEHAASPRLVRDLGVVPGEAVASSTAGTPWYNHQREVYWAEVYRFDALKQGPPAQAQVVIVHSGWSSAGWGWVGGDPAHGWAVWRRL